MTFITNIIRKCFINWIKTIKVRFTLYNIIIMNDGFFLNMLEIDRKMLIYWHWCIVFIWCFVVIAKWIDLIYLNHQTRNKNSNLSIVTMFWGWQQYLLSPIGHSSVQFDSVGTSTMRPESQTSLLYSVRVSLAGSVVGSRQVCLVV